jgi:hypothetical protein
MSRGLTRRLPRWLALGALAAVLLSPACSRAKAAPLEHTLDSPADLATAVLEALARNDRAALAALAISDREFRQVVWPELPASRRERNLPLDYVWGDLRQKSEGHLRQTLAQHGGRRYALVDLEFLGETTAYRTFDVSRKAQLRVRDERGDEQVIRLFGSVLRSGAEYKIFSYVVD